MSSAGSKDVAGWTPVPSNTAKPEVCAAALGEAEPVQIGEPIPHQSRALYDQDEFGWLLEQADLLRDGRLDEIDRVSLVEFLTDMARAKKHEFRSAMIVLLQHLLKVAVQPEKVTRSWMLTIVEQQQEAQFLIEDEPGMRQYCRTFMRKRIPLPVAALPSKPASGSTVSPKTTLGPWTRR